MSDKYNHIDDLFRDKFKDFELDPPDHIWGNIKTQINNSGKGGNGSGLNKGGIYGISIILIVAGLFTWYLLSSSTEENTPIPQEKITLVDETDYKSSTRTISINSDKVFDSQIPNNKKKQNSRFDISAPSEVIKGKSSLVVQDNFQATNFEVSNHNLTTIATEVSADIEALNILTPASDDELLAISDAYQEESETVEEQSAIVDNIAAADLNNDQDSENVETEVDLATVSEVRSDYGQKGKWMFGLFFTPEMIFYPDNNSFNNRSYSLDVNAIYKFNGYFLQSGLGVSWTSDKGKCEIDYNEYLGSYEDVYDVTFDTIGYEVSPVYHTETVQVYDSIDRVSIMPAKNHYTYLQIPLLFGYGNENRRFGWFVKAGPSISIMVHQDLSLNDMSGTEDKIIRIENEVPSRINTNWQFVFAGGLSYKLSNHLSLSAEPVIRYYLNSTYERSQYISKNPYSIGLRVGFLIDL